MLISGGVRLSWPENTPRVRSPANDALAVTYKQMAVMAWPRRAALAANTGADAEKEMQC